ncbi:MAG: hypothetical protein IBX61_04275 [Thermoleophilia bacterium]|nr:hypothetical protein [Thermoleophilia bacterium]
MISTAEIASLKDFTSHDRHPVVSLYLNVNGAQRPTRGDYETEFSILASNLRKTAREELGFTRDQQSLLDEELAAISEYLALQFKRNGTRGLVIFSCKREGLWQVNTMNVPVENRLYVDWKPQVAPLMETLSAFEQICVLVTSKETARIFRVFANEITEHTEILNRVPKHHGQGGWEQNKLQRWHEKEVREHLKQAAEATMEFFNQERFDRLAVGIADDLWPELEKLLHPYLKERILGRFAVDVLNASVNDILKNVNSLAEEERQLEESALLESLGPALAAGKSWVGGLDDVLAALNQRRVDLLLVESGFSEPGRKCTSCDTLEYAEQNCPSCSRRGEKIADVVDEARELAIRQGSRMITVDPGHPEMELASRIVARLRY